MKCKQCIILLCYLFVAIGLSGCPAQNGNDPENTPTPLVKTYPNWQQVNSTQHPNPRVQYGLAYDSHRHVIVMYGGRGWIGSGQSKAFNVFDDTWEYSRETGWIKIETVHNPSKVDYVAMVYDQQRRKVIMFGGIRYQQDNIECDISDETWEYDGTDWTKREFTIKPPERAAHCMVYDSSSHVVYIFSGLYMNNNGGCEYRDDTWYYNGDHWTEVNTEHKPSRRNRAQMVYDSRRDVTVLYGGDRVGGWAPDDVCWEFDGEDWTQIETEHKPGRRTRFGFAFHEGIGRAVFFGGDVHMASMRNDTWEYDGHDWIQIPTETKPGRRTTVMIYNSDQQECFLFSGWDDNLNGYNDQWIYKYFE
ncbi:hypothetical protein JXQ70_13100, partial [bacterium]|nr:hypothetical protein [bacterium]